MLTGESFDRICKIMERSVRETVAYFGEETLARDELFLKNLLADFRINLLIAWADGVIKGGENGEGK